MLERNVVIGVRFILVGGLNVLLNRMLAEEAERLAPLFRRKFFSFEVRELNPTVARAFIIVSGIALMLVGALVLARIIG